VVRNGWLAFGGRLQGKYFGPPVHDSVGFGKEPVGTDIDTVSMVVQGSGQTANKGAFFEDDRLDIGSGEKFIGRSEAGGSCSDDDGGSWHLEKAPL
jgi:hypothetical protein